MNLPTRRQLASLHLLLACTPLGKDILAARASRSTPLPPGGQRANLPRHCTPALTLINPPQLQLIYPSQPPPPDCNSSAAHLVHPLAAVVCVHVCILRAKVAPLEAVHGAQVHLLAVGGRQTRAGCSCAHACHLGAAHRAQAHLFAVGENDVKKQAWEEHHYEASTQEAPLKAALRHAPWERLPGRPTG